MSMMDAANGYPMAGGYMQPQGSLPMAAQVREHSILELLAGGCLHSLLSPCSGAPCSGGRPRLGSVAHLHRAVAALHPLVWWHVC